MVSMGLLEKNVEFDKDFWAKVVAVAQVGKTLFFGWNSSKKTSPRYKRHYDNTDQTLYTRHAEFHVLGKLPRNIKKSKVKIYILRFNMDGDISMAKPCRFCQRKMKEFGINPRNVYFTNWEGEYERLRTWDEE